MAPIGITVSQHPSMMDSKPKLARQYALLRPQTQHTKALRAFGTGMRRTARKSGRASCSSRHNCVAHPFLRSFLAAACRGGGGGRGGSSPFAHPTTSPTSKPPCRCTCRGSVGELAGLGSGTRCQRRGPAGYQIERDRHSSIQRSGQGNKGTEKCRFRKKV